MKKLSEGRKTGVKAEKLERRQKKRNEGRKNGTKAEKQERRQKKRKTYISFDEIKKIVHNKTKGQSWSNQPTNQR
jgi:uncharacterized membrane protein YkoI